MFTAIYTHFKTLLYTNLILTGMNNIFVDLQFTLPHRCTGQITRSPSHKAGRLAPPPRSVCEDRGHQYTRVGPQLYFIKATVIYVEYCSIRYTPISI